MNNDSKSFIVRIWIDSAPEDSAEPAWRGVIEHVGSSDRQHFHELGDVTRFIAEKTGLASGDPENWWPAVKEWARNELRKRLPNLQ